MSVKKKIVWPIDPANSNEVLDKEVYQFLKKMAGLSDLEVYPVYVMPSRYAQMGEYFESYDESSLRSYLEKDSRTYLEQFSDLPLKDLKIIENFHTAQSAEVVLFIDYIEKNNFDFIVLGSHGRKGWEKAFLGSFTESVLLKVKTPVFVIGPHSKGDSDLTRAFMPMELSKGSQEFLGNFLDQHSVRFVDHLKLFHKISMIDYEDIAWAPTFYGVPDYQNEDIVKKARKSTEEIFENFMNHPLSQKRLSYLVSESIDSVTDSVIEESKKDEAGLIIMRSQAGPWETRLLGSLTKTIIREAPVPVLVFPYQYGES